MSVSPLLKAVALPVAAFAGAAGVAVSGLSSMRSARDSQQIASMSRESIVPLTYANDAITGIARAYQELWRAELGYPSEPRAQFTRIERSLDALQSGVLGDATVVAELRAASKSLASLKKEERREQLSGLLDLTTRIEAVRTQLIDEVGGAATEVADAADLAWSATDAFTELSARRIAANIDGRPKSSSLDSYLKRIGETSAGRMPTSLEGVLRNGVSSRSVQLAVSNVAKSAGVRTFAETVLWNARGSDRSVPAVRSSFDSFADSAATLTEQLSFTVFRTINEADATLAATQRSARTRESSGATMAILGAFFAAGALVVLLVRGRRGWTDARRLAARDGLTNALNREGVKAVTTPWFADRGSTPIAVALLDLDHFRSFTDRAGDDAGDAVLASVADAVRGATIPDRTAVGRWGDDEFIAVLRFPGGAREGDAERVAERMRVAVATPVSFGEHAYSVSATVGVAMCHCGNCAFEDLLRNADRAMCGGKARGRNRVRSSHCDSSAMIDALPMPSSIAVPADLPDSEPPAAITAAVRAFEAIEAAEAVELEKIRESQELQSAELRRAGEEAAARTAMQRLLQNA